MNPHKLTIHILVLLAWFISCNTLPETRTLAQKRRAPPGGRVAVVVDESLSALRATPQLSGKLVRRVGRGKLVSIRAARSSQDGIVFLLVNVTSRTHGWIQREALVSASYPGDDEKLLNLVRISKDYDRVARSRIFLENFPHSPLRAEVLLLLGDTAEEVSAKLTRDALRRISDSPHLAPEFSYFLNYTGLDRYNRQGVGFVFDRSAKRFHYDGSAWQEVVRRYPRTPQAQEARDRLRRLGSWFTG
jgi:hypothetical protein